MQNHFNTIIRPLVTEKATQSIDKLNQYYFAVAPDSNKIQVKNAIEKIFNVKVLKVHTMNYLGKIKRHGRWLGKSSEWKKAIVTLRSGDSINLFPESK